MPNQNVELIECALCKSPTCKECATPYRGDDLKYIGLICKECVWEQASSTDDINRKKFTLKFLMSFIPVLNFYYYYVVVFYIRYLPLNPSNWLTHYRKEMQELNELAELPYFHKSRKPKSVYPMGYILPGFLFFPLLIIWIGSNNSNRSPVFSLEFTIFYFIPLSGIWLGMMVNVIVADRYPMKRLYCNHIPDDQKKKGRRKKYEIFSGNIGPYTP